MSTGNDMAIQPGSRWWEIIAKAPAKSRALISRKPIGSAGAFLFLVMIILVITCVEISIALTYFQLTSEDYNWWWRAFLT